jgi:nucleoside-diphosphate-sugar epimerase
MKVLVTGASGFLGHRVIPLLLELEIQTTALDLIPPKISACEFLSCDLSDEKSVETVLHRRSFDSVLHLAGVRGSRNTMTRVNILGTTNLLKTLADRCGSFVIASSCSVYGRPQSTTGRVSETDCTEPVTEYGTILLEKERIATNICTENTVDLTIARLFNLFGPGQHTGMMVSSTAQKIADILAGRAKPPMHTGPLHTERDLIDVEDAARALVKMALTRCPSILNVGTGVSISGMEIVTALQTAFGTDIPVKEDYLGSDGVQRIFADISRTSECLGWKPEKPFFLTIQEIVERLHSPDNIDPFSVPD